MQSARRRLPQPGRSRSPFPTESFLPEQELERMELLSRDQYELARLRTGNQMKAESRKKIIKAETKERSSPPDRRLFTLFLRALVAF
jgi:hypothetical protein